MNDRLTEYRKLRIFGMSVIDFVLTFIFVFILHTISWFYIVSARKQTISIYFLSFLILFIVMIVIGIVAHLAFGVKTVMLAYMGLNSMPDISLQ
jgi:hypothetical protein